MLAVKHVQRSPRCSHRQRTDQVLRNTLPARNDMDEWWTDSKQVRRSQRCSHRPGTNQVSRNGYLHVRHGGAALATKQGGPEARRERYRNRVEAHGG